jgi:MFS family permease
VKLEQFPIVLGVIVFLIAAALAYDSMSPEERRPFRERRRRQRAELNRTGELFVALGTACVAAALVGRDSWRWGNIAIFAAVALLIVGGALNREFLRELLLFRGASRRAASDESTPKVADVPRRSSAPSDNGRSRVSGMSQIAATPAQRMRIR